MYTIDSEVVWEEGREGRREEGGEEGREGGINWSKCGKKRSLWIWVKWISQTHIYSHTFSRV